MPVEGIRAPGNLSSRGRHGHKARMIRAAMSGKFMGASMLHLTRPLSVLRQDSRTRQRRVTGLSTPITRRIPTLAAIRIEVGTCHGWILHHGASPAWARLAEGPQCQSAQKPDGRLLLSVKAARELSGSGCPSHDLRLASEDQERYRGTGGRTITSGPHAAARETRPCRAAGVN